MQRLILALLLLTATVCVTACADSGGRSDLDAAADGDTTGSADSTAQDATSAPDGADPLDPVDPNGDEDGDRISNADEGAATRVDTDGDGIPDYLDTDSDNDGIPDALEAGDRNLLTPPIDSDGDGIPDFRDTDSDNNGIPDRLEVGPDPLSPRDTDGDGIPDHLDPDNDGDFIDDVTEIVGAGADCDRNGIPDPLGLPLAPRDCDLDGIPDYMSRDSDGDFISDTEEGLRDSDRDGWFDRYDHDSDNDGIPDSVEAGDRDLSTPARDTDGDGIPDYRDPDSDDDGLSDHLERITEGLDPLNPDSDGDGVSDLIEFAAGSDPADPEDHPRARGDFVFVVPYQDESSPERDTFPFNTSIRQLDLYLNFDTTTSMFDELAALRSLQTGLPAVVNELLCDTTGPTCTRDRDCGEDAICRFDGRCVVDPLAGPEVCIPDIFTGVGAFDELDTYRNLVALQHSATTAANAIPGTRVGTHEAPSQAAACVANANNCNNSNRNCQVGGVGCPAFRQGAIRVLVQISDADEQCTDTCGGCRCQIFSTAFVGNELASRKIRFVGLYGTDDDSAANPQTPLDLMTALAVASGSLGIDGSPFVFQAIDDQVVPNLLRAVREIVVGVPVEVSLAVLDVGGDLQDARRFVDRIEVNTSGEGACTAQLDGVALVTSDRDGDGVPETFDALLPGTPICFDLVPIAINDFAPSTDEPQMFRAILEVRGDGSAVDRRDVFFLVPPRKLVLN